jgi:hypothetical protein
MLSGEEVFCKRDYRDISHGQVASHASVSASDVLSEDGMQVSRKAANGSPNKGYYDHRHCLFPTLTADHQCCNWTTFLSLYLPWSADYSLLPLTARHLGVWWCQHLPPTILYPLSC